MTETNQSNAAALVKRLESLGVEVCFTLTGGYILPLEEELRKSKIEVVPVLHEQAAAMAAQTYGDICKRPALVLVTNGPGVTNCLTGLAAAYIDGTPMFVVSGEVMEKARLDRVNPNLRQAGIQQIPTASLVTPLVKKFETVTTNTDLNALAYSLYDLTLRERGGPVWLEFPLDLQNANSLLEVPTTSPTTEHSDAGGVYLDSDRIRQKLSRFEISRPLVICGRGLQHSPFNDQLIKDINDSGLPVVLTWGARDLAYKFENYIGSPGIAADRVGNFALASCDLIFSIGARGTFTQFGYDAEGLEGVFYLQYDVDVAELDRVNVPNHLPVKGDLKDASCLVEISAIFNSLLGSVNSENSTIFLTNLRNLKDLTRIQNEPHLRMSGFLNTYDALDTLNNFFARNCGERGIILILDAGTAYRGSMQSLASRPNLKTQFAGGLASMGSCLPGILGGHHADKGAYLVGVTGDGSFSMNLQELATIRKHVPQVLLVILDDGGYLTIRASQETAGLEEFVSSERSGMGKIPIQQISDTFDFKTMTVQDATSFEAALKESLGFSHTVIRVKVPPDQKALPRRSSRTPGRSGLADMYPHLDENFLATVFESLNNNKLIGDHTKPS